MGIAKSLRSLLWELKASIVEKFGACEFYDKLFLRIGETQWVQKLLCSFWVHQKYCFTNGQLEQIQEKIKSRLDQQALLESDSELFQTVYGSCFQSQLWRTYFLNLPIDWTDCRLWKNLKGKLIRSIEVAPHFKPLNHHGINRHLHSSNHWYHSKPTWKQNIFKKIKQKSIKNRWRSWAFLQTFDSRFFQYCFD